MMTMFLRHVVPLLASVILATPPGSCCIPAKAATSESQPIRPSCCHKKVSSRECEHSGRSTTPSVKCCCEHVSPLPEQPVRAPQSWATSYDIPTFGSLFDIASCWARARDESIRSGPRLQILLCVWRC